MSLLLLLYLGSVYTYYGCEAAQLTCDNTTRVCPGTEVTCSCIVPSVGAVSWLLQSVSMGEYAMTLNTSNIGNKIRVGPFDLILANVTDRGRQSMMSFVATEAMSLSITCLEPDSGATALSDITVTLPDPPRPPNSLVLLSTTYNSATIQWTAPSNNGGSDITGYTIIITPPTSGDSTCPLGSCTVSSDTVTYHITGLGRAANYVVHVAAINCAGTGDSMHIDTVIPQATKTTIQPASDTPKSSTSSQQVAVTSSAGSVNILPPNTPTCIVTCLSPTTTTATTSPSASLLATVTMQANVLTNCSKSPWALGISVSLAVIAIVLSNVITCVCCVRRIKKKSSETYDLADNGSN